jgi:hypothetical protein
LTDKGFQVRTGLPFGAGVQRLIDEEFADGHRQHHSTAGRRGSADPLT